MLRQITILVSVLLLVSCGGEKKAPEQIAKSENALTIRLCDSLIERGISDTLRFGHLHSGEIAHLDFWIENRTPKPVVPLMVKRTCGCTDLEYDQKPIAPDEERRCRIIFDSRGIYGWQLKLIDLKLAGYERPVRLFIEAEVD